MRFEVAGKIRHEPGEVYLALRDDLPLLVERLPDVERVEEIAREPAGDGRLRILTRWQVRPKLPRTVLRAVPDAVFRWTDEALWSDEELRVEYRIEGFAYEVRGENVFERSRGGTRIGLDGELVIDPAPLGVPGFLLRAVLPVVQRSLRAGLEANLRKVIGVLGAHLDDR